MEQAGEEGAGPVGSSWNSWGEQIIQPVYGAVVIFKTGHVGFYLDTYSDGTLKILHGNWSNKITVSNKFDPVNANQISTYRFH